MASSDTPWRSLLLGLLACCALEQALFGSSWYAAHQSPVSVAGDWWHTIEEERRRPGDPAHTVAILGNSKIRQGLNMPVLAGYERPGGLHFVSLAVEGSQMEWWYHQLRILDPDANRFRAVVIPVNGYRVRPEAGLLKFQADDGMIVAVGPFLHLRDWPDVLAGLDGWPEKAHGLAQLLFPAMGRGADAIDFARGPDSRLALVAARERDGAHERATHQGLGPETLSGLRYDRATGTVSAWPAHFTLAKQKEALRYMRPPADPVGQTMATYAYERTWLTRIAAYYRHSHTAVIVVPVPAYGVPMAGVDPIADAPDIRDAFAGSPDLRFLPEPPFAALQRPDDFNDVLHMNTAGNTRFTALLACAVEHALGAVAAPCA
jgi:hypothetical protein